MLNGKKNIQLWIVVIDLIPNNTQSLHEPDVKSLDSVFANTVKSNLNFFDVCSFNDVEFNLHKFRCRNMIMIKSHQFTALRSTTEWGNIKGYYKSCRCDLSSDCIHSQNDSSYSEFKEWAGKLTMQLKTNHFKQNVSKRKNH